MGVCRFRSLLKLLEVDLISEMPFSSLEPRPSCFHFNPEILAQLEILLVSSYLSVPNSLVL